MVLLTQIRKSRGALIFVLLKDKCVVVGIIVAFFATTAVWVEGRDATADTETVHFNAPTGE